MAKAIRSAVSWIIIAFFVAGVNHFLRFSWFAPSRVVFVATFAIAGVLSALLLSRLGLLTKNQGRREYLWCTGMTLLFTYLLWIQLLNIGLVIGLLGLGNSIIINAQVTYMKESTRWGCSGVVLSSPRRAMNPVYCMDIKQFSGDSLPLPARVMGRVGWFGTLVESIEISSSKG